MKSPHPRFTLALPFILAFASSVSSQDAATKAPVPSAAAQAEAMKLIKEVYGDEYSKAKATAEKQALAKKLLAKANESKDDPANQFVLLRLARDIGTQAGDGQTAFQAVDAMVETFQVDALEMKSVVLTKVAATVRTPEQHKLVAEEALKLADQAVSRDNFALADQLGQLAFGEARKASGKELISKAQSWITKVAELAKASEDVKAARVTLEKTPDDPEANLIVGKYLCFTKGDWDRGLLMLALGKDEALRTLAQNELQGAASSTEQANLGDGWWKVAEQEEGSRKKQIQGRASYWYQKALPGLSGVMKDKALKRSEALPTTTDIAAHRDASQSEDKAVSAALHWLARHQSPDGRWSLDHTRRCIGKTCSGPGQIKADAGATALGLLPFLAAGHTHRTPGPFQMNILRGVNWLVKHQDRSGNLGTGCVQPMYSHALATIVLCEAYGLSRDKRLKAASQNAINYIMNAQNKNDGGWRYNPGDAGDTSVVGWQITALKAGQTAGLSVGRSTFQLASMWFDRVKCGPNGCNSQYQANTGPTPVMTAVALRSQQSLGVERNNPMMVDGTQYLMRNMPDATIHNVYYWYYATQVMHNYSGSEWDTWNRAMRNILTSTQVIRGCAAGSWDPESPSKDAWAGPGGRIYVTSLATLILEMENTQLQIYK